MDEGAALDRLLLVSTLLADDMATALQARGLTRARATVLWEVARHGPLTQRQIADLLGVTPRNVTTLIDALEGTGFVTRTDHLSDRRAVLVRLTEQGELAAARMERGATHLARKLFGELSAPDLATFTGVLDHITARFSDTGVSG
ncbi:transcriptional regulator, MarR family [Kribbella flavida DSM 17836]|uniref:Transcriptional regulator, MarR family n=1 Tax=Kribbella flavida (strain DSM 17836 / JCM 10339 / NBRC 14399) TaxID=479435 RepID=D2PQX8_KRIFD|nr:MarR family transcriptional regulator [Kribbella flavida]ADB31111.1 transcriptional regulator, MarR family [Kribbella flavida DSM 17836]